MLYFRNPSDDLGRKLNVGVNIFKSVKSEKVLVKYQARELVSQEFLQNKHFFCPWPCYLCRRLFTEKMDFSSGSHLNKQVPTPFSIFLQVAEMLLITIYKYIRQTCG